MLKGGATRLVFHAYLCYYRLSWLILQSRFSNLRTMEKSCFMDLQTKGDFTTWPLILSRMRRLRSWNVYFCSLCTWWHFQIWHWMLVNKVFTGPLQLLWISFFWGGGPSADPFYHHHRLPKVFTTPFVEKMDSRYQETYPTHFWLKHTLPKAILFSQAVCITGDGTKRFKAIYVQIHEFANQTLVLDFQSHLSLQAAGCIFWCINMKYSYSSLPSRLTQGI